MKNKKNIYLILGIDILIIFFCLFLLIYNGFKNHLVLTSFLDYLKLFKGIMIIPLSILILSIYLLIMLIKFLNKQTQEEIMYLNTKIDNCYYFLNQKGQKYLFYSLNNYDLKHFYKVLVKGWYIEKIIFKEKDNYKIPHEKINYFSSFYAPFVKLEKIILIPIIYILIIIITSNILNSPKFKLLLIVIDLFLVFLLLYDLIYKLKKKSILKKLNNHPNVPKYQEELNILENQGLRIFDKFYNSYSFIIAFLMFVILIYLFITTKNLYVIPFLLGNLIYGLMTLSDLLKSFKRFSSIWNLKIFIIFWVIMCLVMTIIAFKGSEKYLFIFVIFFWLKSFNLIYNNFPKRK